MCAMPRRSATQRIAASGTQPPACSWARHSSGIPADACRPSGYLAICPFAHCRFSAVKAKSLGCRCGSARRRTAITPSLYVSSVHLPEHDVDRAQDRGDIGQHVAAAEEIHGREMSEAGRADLALVGLVGAVGDKIDAELALGRLDGGVDFARRHVKALGVELE